MFESFGISEELIREAYHVIEIAFWQDIHDGKGMRRVRYNQDTDKGLSWQPHVILNQARINGLLLEKMQRDSGMQIDYGWEVKSVELIKNGECVNVKAMNLESGVEHEWNTRYLLACDGAHSNVRRSIGYKMVGDSSDVVWGVCDVYPQTDFPDIRKKATLHCDAGTLIIIPREGGSLVRFYIEMPTGTKAQDVKLENIREVAQQIFLSGGYTMEFADTFWWSAYSIGQRLAEDFSLGNRVFLTGDACKYSSFQPCTGAWNFKLKGDYVSVPLNIQHNAAVDLPLLRFTISFRPDSELIEFVGHTHSPKAGQGMNVSLQDGYNIGWKLAMVLKGHADPSLLRTYDLERGKVAADLVEFDRNWTKLISGKHSDSGDTAVDQNKISNAFKQASKYTAGLTAKYSDSELTSAASSKQDLAANIIVGMRFPSSQVIRFCDAKPMQLARALKADGRWRIVIFAGDLQEGSNKARLDRLAEFLDSTEGPVRSVTSKRADIDSLIETIVVLSGKRHDTEQEDLHPYFWPVTGKWKMRGKLFSFPERASIRTWRPPSTDKMIRST